LPKFASLPTHDTHDDAAKEANEVSGTQPHRYRSLLLFLITASATTALAIYSIPAAIVLGLCSAIFTAFGLVLLERATGGVEEDHGSGIYEVGSAGVSQPGRRRSSRTPSSTQLATIRDIAATLAFTCALASMLIEPSVYSIYREPLSRKHQQHWTKGYDSMILLRILWMVPVNAITNSLMYIIVSCFLLGNSCLRTR
jgi:hypothetical protein